MVWNKYTTLGHLKILIMPRHKKIDSTQYSWVIAQSQMEYEYWYTNSNTDSKGVKQQPVDIQIRCNRLEF